MVGIHLGYEVMGCYKDEVKMKKYINNFIIFLHIVVLLFI